MFSSTRFARVVALAAIVTTMPTAIANAQPQLIPPQTPFDDLCAVPPDCGKPALPLIDNRDGYLVNLEEGPVHPIELTDQGELWAVNLPDASIAIFDTTTPNAFALLDEIEVALGPVSVRQRPGTQEMWIACQSSNAMVIVDATRRRVIGSISLPHEPTDSVFTADGARAFVTLSSSNEVAEIDTATRAVTQVRAFASRFPDPTSDLESVEEPTTLLLDGNDLFVLSKESGNGTMGENFAVGTVTIMNGWDLYDPVNNVPPPPDRDAIHFDISSAADGQVALWRMGSMNFDLARDDQGSLWVSNMDYNNELLGEFHFPTQGVARHRLTRATPLPAMAPTQAPFAIDLNADALPALRAQGYSCAMPNEMLFSPDFSTIYVACYETHNVAVVDVASSQVIAELRSLRVHGGTGQAFRFGARGLAADWANNTLYVYSRGDVSVQQFKIPPTPGTVASPARSARAGFDISRPELRQGRFPRHQCTALESRYPELQHLPYRRSSRPNRLGLVRFHRSARHSW